mgnify:CR=1 FL=1
MKQLSNRFIISKDPIHHTLDTEEGNLEVWIKPLSWIETQEALTKFVEFNMDGDDIQPQLDFGGYWKYVLNRCVVRTEPEIKKSDLNKLKPEVGNKLQAVLPSLTELMETLGGESAPLG